MLKQKRCFSTSCRGYLKLCTHCTVQTQLYKPCWNRRDVSLLAEDILNYVHTVHTALYRPSCINHVETEGRILVKLVNGGNKKGERYNLYNLDKLYNLPQVQEYHLLPIVCSFIEINYKYIDHYRSLSL